TARKPTTDRSHGRTRSRRCHHLAHRRPDGRRRPSRASVPARRGGGAHPRRRRISALIAGTTSCRSPITACVALVTIGASGSVLIARMLLADEHPAQCWMAPLMPRGMYGSGEIGEPV